MASHLSHLLHADPAPAHPLPPPLSSSSSSSSRPAPIHPPPPAITPLASSSGPSPVGLFRPPQSPLVGAPVGGIAPLQTPVTPTTPADQARGHANSTSLYQCADCLKRYSRPEHLQRHIATHTLGKRFVCDVCGKAFARADLLKRHRTNHDENDNGTKRRRINTSPGAGRVAHACQACARARVKCEELKPCTRCRNRKIECEYASSEAGSAAAMHLLHLSASAHSRPSHAQSDGLAAAAVVASHQGASPSSYGDQHHHQLHGHHHAQVQNLPPVSNTVGVKRASESPVVTSHPTFIAEETQLPTPETMMDQGNADGFQPPPPSCTNPNTSAPMAVAPAASMQDPRLPFSDFLRDIMYPLADPSRMAEAQGLAVLDFCDDSNLELNDLDFGVMDNWNLENTMTGMAGEHEFGGAASSAAAAAALVGGRVEDAADLSGMRQRLVNMWTESPWRWNPNKQDSGYREQAYLDVPSREISGVQFQESRQRLDRVVKDKLEPSGRDKILAIVLSTCQNNAMLTRVASSFPSTEVMDSLIHIFLASHLCQVSEWIDYASFNLNSQWPEWLACAAAAGAILTPNTTLRKFGYALQEAVRVTIPSRFEDNNSNVMEIGLVQALILIQDIGLWSGNRRKMEIAECHLNIPITMIRYRGQFQRSQYPPVTVSPSDQGAELEAKWAKWRERESWKRLVFHCYLRDSQMSITTLTPPHISYSELTLPLPESRQLWFARTAQEWQMHYLESAAGATKRPPSLGDLFRDINLLSANHRRLDVQLAISIYLHGFWSLIWEFRQLSAVQRSGGGGTFSPGLGGAGGGGAQADAANLLLQSRHQELTKLLHNFQAITADWHERSAQGSLVLNLLQMNLHVSLDDLQLFSGKEGEEQARRVFPALQRWSETTEARRALWHAGQILGIAKMFPPGHLKDFYAIAVYHAALALWTWGVVRKSAAASRRPSSSSVVAPGGVPGSDRVYLDGPDSFLVQRYISFGQTRAAIRGPSSSAKDGGGGGGGGSMAVTDALLEDPRLCMEVAQDILRANFIEGKDSLPPIAENLCHLIKQLGNAAWAVGLG